MCISHSCTDPSFRYCTNSDGVLSNYGAASSFEDPAHSENYQIMCQIRRHRIIQRHSSRLREDTLTGSIDARGLTCPCTHFSPGFQHKTAPSTDLETQKAKTTVSLAVTFCGAVVSAHENKWLTIHSVASGASTIVIPHIFKDNAGARKPFVALFQN